MNFLRRHLFVDITVTVSPTQALEFWRNHADLHSKFMVMAADWRVDWLPEGEDVFEELTADELDDEYFLEDFADARLQIWSR